MLAILFCLLSVVNGLAPLMGTENAERIQGSYIVIFHTNTTKAQRAPHATVTPVAQFAIDSFAGYSAKLTAEQLATIRADPAVAYVECDQIVRLPSTTIHSIHSLNRTAPVEGKSGQACNVQQSATWGISRISYRVSQKTLNYYHPNTDGLGVDVYVIDTGIQVSHDEYRGRATWGVNFAPAPNLDCHGHGTHVAGTVAGTLHGVAKRANVIAVKVLDCSGSGTMTGVIQGVEWSTAQGREKRGVMNLSLGGGLSLALNAAIKASVDAGMVPAVAGGNSNTDACNTSPASEPTAFTAGASDMDAGPTGTDIRASFSNFGTCVDIFAPGRDVTAAWIDQAGQPPNGVYAVLSGTSMASPHVAGVVALGKGQPAENPPVNDWKAHIISKSVDGIINMNCGGNAKCLQTPNKMLYNYWCGQ